MTPIIDQKALEEFIDQADLGEIRRCEAALDAMSAAVHLRVVELETQPSDPVLKPLRVG